MLGKVYVFECESLTLSLHVAPEVALPDEHGRTSAQVLSSSLSLAVSTLVVRGADRTLDQLSLLMLCLFRDGYLGRELEKRKLPHLD